jgi:plastocyanin
MRTVFVAALAGLGLLHAAPASAAVVMVHVIDSEFTPDPTIRPGDTVQWMWEGFMPHSTTSVRGIPEQWDSGILGPGSTYSHTFTRVGNWNYYCIPHGFDNGNGTASGMAGVIRVVPEPTGACLAGVAGLALLARRRRPARG